MRTSFLSLLAGLAAGVAAVASGFGTPEAFRIPLVTDFPPGATAQPVYVGIPFPKGWKVDASALGVVDEAGQPVAASSREMARWPGSDSVRWAGVDFQGEPGKRYFVVPRKEMPPSGVVVKEEEGVTMVDTGAARFSVPARGPLLAKAWAGGEERLSTGGELYLMTTEGVEATASADQEQGQLVVETATSPAPQRLVVRREGWYTGPKGERVAKHVTRLHFHAGESMVKVENSLIITQDAAAFREVGFRARYAPVFRPVGVWLPESAEPQAKVQEVPLAGGEVFLFQEKAFHFDRMDEKKDCHFLIGRVEPNGRVEPLREGSFAGDWLLAAAKGGKGVGLVLPELWQQFPKELAADRSGIVLRLWAGRGGEVLDFSAPAMAKRWPQAWLDHYTPWGERVLKDKNTAVGIARTHTFYLDVAATAPRLANWSRPAIALADPQWLRESEAFGAIHPKDTARFPEAEGFMETWYDQFMSVVRQWGEYGFFDYGAAPHTWYRRNPARDNAWEPYLTRYGVDYGFHTHLWRMAARSGERKYFDTANRMGRHWLDFKMVHREAGEGVKLPGGFRFGSYTPRHWGGSPGLHHQSGTDIRSLAWLYYYTDFRPAREMLESYTRTVKELWATGDLRPFRGSRPFATLKNLATVYQETGDAALLPMIDTQVEWLVDLDAPQGVNRARETTGLAKYTTKGGAMQRAYIATGNELAGKALTKGAYLRAKTTLGNVPLSYYNNSAEQLHTAWRITKDPELVRTLQRDLQTAVALFRGKDGWEWIPGTFPSVAGNPYALGDMAFAMDAIVSYEAEQGHPPEVVPMARQAGYGRPMRVVVGKPEGEAIQLDVRSVDPIRPVVRDAKGAIVEGVEAQVPKAYLYVVKPSPKVWNLTLPAALPGGVYVVESGADGAMWEVTWSNAKKLVMLAPGGIITSGEGRRWGNRIMPTAPDAEAWVWFQVPEEAEQFEVYAARPLGLRLPDGSERELEPKEPGWQTVAVPEAARGKLWAFRSKGDFVQLRGVPPYLAYGEAKRYFEPKLGEVFQTTAPATRFALPQGEAFYQSPAGEPGPAHGVVLAGNRQFFAPADTLLKAEEGTLEFWVKPAWSSVDQFNRKGTQRVLMQAGKRALSFHRYGEMSVTALIPGENGGIQEANAGVALEAGQWTHIAFQWRQQGEHLLTEFFINGHGQGTGTASEVDDEADEGAPPKAKPLRAAPWEGEAVFGARGPGSPELVLGGVRFSSGCRYSDDFDPAQADTLAADAQTTGLYLFNETAEGATGNGEHLSGRISTGR